MNNGLLALAGGSLLVLGILPSVDRIRDLVGLAAAALGAALLTWLSLRSKRESGNAPESTPPPDFRAEIGLTLNSDASLPVMLKTCAEAILSHCSAAFVRIWTLSETEQVLELRTSVGLYTHTDGKHSRIPVGSFKIGEIALRREPLLTNNLAHSKKISDPEWARREGFVAFAGHPLICGDVLVGVIGLFARNPLSPHLLNDLKVAADAIAMGISRKRSEAALRAGEARIRAIIESALDCIITVDRNSKVIEFNPAAEKTFGYSREEVLGKDLAELIIPGVHRCAHHAGMKRFIATGNSQVLNKRLYDMLPALRKDGTEFPTELTVVPLEFNGEPVFIGFLRDITEQKRAESRRTDAEAALQKAIVQAENANQAKNLFLANMSHEFRTPMGAIVGYAEMLLSPQLGLNERAQIVGAIGRNGRHLLSIINDILDLSKIEAGKMQLEIVSCRPWRIISEAISVAGVLAGEKRIALSVYQIGKVPRFLTSDPTRLRQILDNLLSNAVKFTPQGGNVELRIRMVDGDENGKDLLIEVEDEGVGISKESADKLFEPFVQADSTTTRQFGGTGLGLSICDRIVSALGGWIGLSSEPGKGTLFSVHLPIDPADLEDLVDEEGAARDTQPSALQFRPAEAPILRGNVLVAEDNLDNQHIIRFFLQRAGLNVEMVDNGEKAVNSAMAGDFDFLLMDMQMPHMDGYSATSLLRQKGFTKPIIALTAHAMSGDEEKCKAVGCDGYLAKPLEIDRLVKILGRLAKNNRLSVAVVSKAPGSSSSTQDLATLREIYIASMPTKIASIRRTLEARDRPRLREESHRLNGSAGMYGFPDLAETAALVEAACIEGRDFDLLSDLVAELESAAGAVR